MLADTNIANSTTIKIHKFGIKHFTLLQLLNQSCNTFFFLKKSLKKCEIIVQEPNPSSNRLHASNSQIAR